MIEPGELVSRGKGSEHSHQCAVMQWVALYGRGVGSRYAGIDLLFAIPNGGDRSMSVAAGLKAEGVKSGVPDLFLPVPKQVWAGLWIEMKKPGARGKDEAGGRSEAQVTWHKRLRAQRYAVVVAYGWEAAIMALKGYYVVWDADLKKRVHDLKMIEDGYDDECWFGIGMQGDDALKIGR